MPLSEPAARTAKHVRTIVCEGYLRDDGRWDVEGHLIDTKGYDFDNAERGTIHAGEHVHEMWLRLTVDDHYEIHEVEAVTDYAPFGICGDVAPVFQQLVGLKIAPGWNLAARKLVGGVAGCTHIVELLGPLGTTVLQTIRPSQKPDAQRGKKKGVSMDESKEGKRPRVIDTCHALRADGPVVERHWPDWYEGRD
ncbi:MAG: DUF2889 domain-containing protein [Alphaproteobacteria bacterium]|nr:DUF2889 domain-containing protein [Alphaproteobacteria bacterium]